MVGGQGFKLQFYKIGHLVNRKYYCHLDRGINLVTGTVSHGMSTCMCGIFVSISQYFPSSVSHSSKNVRFFFNNFHDIICLFDRSIVHQTIFQSDKINIVYFLYDYSRLYVENGTSKTTVTHTNYVIQ